MKQVATVVRGALDQARVDAEAKVALAAAEAAALALAATATNQPPTTPLNPDGTPATTANAAAPAPAAQPTSVTLPSTTAIKYAYIGQSVLTLQHILDAQAKRAQDAAVSAGGLLTLPIINADKWAARATTGYVDSGAFIVQSMKIVDKE